MGSDTPSVSSARPTAQGRYRGEQDDALHPRRRAARMRPGLTLVTLDGQRLSALNLAEVPGDHGGRAEPNVGTLTQPEAGDVLVPPRRIIDIPNIPSEQPSVLSRHQSFRSRLCLSRVMHPSAWVIGP